MRRVLVVTVISVLVLALAVAAAGPVLAGHPRSRTEAIILGTIVRLNADRELLNAQHIIEALD